MELRRKVLLALGSGAFTLALPAFTQQEKRVRRIGFLSVSNAEAEAKYVAAFRHGMAELRWVEGRDYVIDPRYANGVAQAGPGLATELVASQPDLLLAHGDGTVRLLAQKTSTTPIVFAVGQDPVGNGLVGSLQRPGANITGLTIMAHELSAKRLQLLKEAFPRVAKVVILFETDNVGSSSQAKITEETAGQLGMRVTSIGLRHAGEIDSAFRRGATLGAQAYIVATGFVFLNHRQTIVDRIGQLKVPASFANSESVEAGGLMSYSPSYPDNFRRAASYVDKIFKGARPGDLPIEQPTKFELVVNLKTARAMGITFPQSFLARADRLIE